MEPKKLLSDEIEPLIENKNLENTRKSTKNPSVTLIEFFQLNFEGLISPKDIDFIEKLLKSMIFVTI